MAPDVDVGAARGGSGVGADGRLHAVERRPDETRHNGGDISARPPGAPARLQLSRELIEPRKMERPIRV